MTYISADGRVTAKRPGIGDGNDSFESAVWAKMIEIFSFEIEIMVRARILPALEVMAVEHRLRESDFVLLARHSPTVPPGRERLFGKALFLGYDGTFPEALHLLVPQIENMVRTCLKSFGVRTTNLDSDGIENEVGLSSLMSRPEVDQLFEANIAFELRALFCDPLGPNLRNEVAHGLLDDRSAQSGFSVYAWWLSSNLCVIPARDPQQKAYQPQQKCTNRIMTSTRWQLSCRYSSDTRSL